MYSEPTRRTAMEQARDTGMISFTGKVKLLQETSTGVQAGVLSYYPVYAKDSLPQNAEHRRAALLGWAYSPYRMNDLMRGILKNDLNDIQLEVFDGNAIRTNALLFDSEQGKSVPSQPATFTRVVHLDIGGHTWTLRYSSLPGYAATTKIEPPWVLFAAVLIISLLLFVITWAFINTQRRAAVMADELTASLRESKEQFRTTFEQAAVGIAHIEPNTGRFLKVNHRFGEFIGYSRSELEQMQFNDVIHPEDIEIGSDGLRQLAERAIEHFSVEKRYIHKSGRMLWGNLTLSAVFDRNGDHEYNIAVVEDITERKQVEDALAEREKLFKAITDTSPLAIYMSAGLEQRAEYINPTFIRLFGYTLDEVPSAAEWWPRAYPDPAYRNWIEAEWQRKVERAITTRSTIEPMEAVVTCKDGSQKNISWGFVSTGPQNWAFGLDFTARKQAESQLQLAASVFTHAREGILITDAEANVIDTNAAFTAVTGYSREEAIGRNPRFLSAGRQDAAFYSALWNSLIEKGYWQGEIWNRRKDGEVYVQLMTISAVRDAGGQPQHYVALFADITEQKNHQQRIEHIAHYDALTGLPNRVLLADRLHQSMAQTLRRERLLAVAFLDLDGFKAINDSHGHDMGDQLLMTIANRMKQAVRDGDTVARLGGDEFVAVMQDLADIEDCVPLLLRLLDAAAQPVHVGELVLQVSASIGVTFYPLAEAGVEADQLLRQADLAMYQAKLLGKNRYHIFDAEQDRSVRGHHDSLEAIQHALDQGEFVLYYQPKVNMRSGEVIGAEALIRWQHPERGLLLPAKFLPVIEDHPLAVDLGEWVIDSALAQMETWHSLGLDLPVSVNVGARQLQEPNFVDRLHALLANHPSLQPHGLELEVLETSALADLAKISAVINACQKVGVRFALDDFGTGYSSLTYLKHLPAAVLKIDQSFVRDMLDDPDDLAILEGVLGLATAFRREAIAEGVETLAHGVMLLQLGCERAQGYAIARPMPALEFPGWAATWRTDASWHNQASISHEDLPVLFSAVEHRAWVLAIEKYIKGGRETPPPLDQHQCRFGQWLDVGAQARHTDQSAFPGIVAIHREIHALGTALLKLQADGDKAEALAGLDELHALQEDLLEKFQTLVK
jgi:diguanylate cyclase (GGDEF)-like protein/PAS domain S-box-containing protein